MIYNAKICPSVGDYGRNKKNKTSKWTVKNSMCASCKHKTGLDYLFCCLSQNARTVSDSDCQKFWNMTKCIWQRSALTCSIKYALFRWIYKHFRLYMVLKAIHLIWQCAHFIEKLRQTTVSFSMVLRDRQSCSKHANCCTTVFWNCSRCTNLYAEQHGLFSESQL